MRLDEKIEPGLGIGRLMLNQMVDDSRIDDNVVVIRMGEEHDHSLLGGCVLILVDYNGEIFQITALSGFVGRLANKYSVGQPISELDNSWKFRDEIDGFVSDCYPNTIIRANVEDATRSELQYSTSDFLIAEISVVSSRHI